MATRSIATITKEDFYRLINDQALDGTWSVSPSLSSALFISEDQLVALIGELTTALGLQTKIPAYVAPTLIALAFLESKFADIKGTWNLLSQKAHAALAPHVNRPVTDAVNEASKLYATYVK